MATTKAGLSNADIASLTPVIITSAASWVTQGTYTSSTLGKPPVGGRKISIYVPTPPDVGDAMVIKINDVTLSPVLYDGYDDLITAILAQSGVVGCYERSDGFGVTILFESGNEALVTLTTMPEGAETVDVTEGVEVSSCLWADVLMTFTGDRSELAVQDITYYASGAYRGTAGNSLQVAYVESGTSTPLSVSWSSPTLTVNLETDGGGSAVSTAAEVLAAVRSSEAAMTAFSVALTGNAATVQAAAAATPLASGTAATYQFRAWRMPSGSNEWVLGTLNQAIDLVFSTGLSSGIRESYLAPVNVADTERIYIEVAAVSAGSVEVKVARAGV